MASITEIRAAVVPISSAIANAYIDFSKMTASVVAIVSDVTRDGGYPPLMLDNVDFATLYRHKLAELQAAQAEQPAN